MDTKLTVASKDTELQGTSQSGHTICHSWVKVDVMGDNQGRTTVKTNKRKVKITNTNNMIIMWPQGGTIQCFFFLDQSLVQIIAEGHAKKRRQRQTPWKNYGLDCFAPSETGCPESVQLKENPRLLRSSGVKCATLKKEEESQPYGHSYGWIQSQIIVLPTG